MKSSKELLKDSWTLFRKRWAMILSVPIIAFLANMLFNLLVSPPVLSAIGLDKIDSKTGATFVWLAILGAILFVVVWLINVIISAMARIAMPYSISVFDAGRDLTLKELFKTSWKKLLSYVWVVILYSCVVIPGFILLIIPGIYFLIVFSFAQIANVVDGKKGLSALAFSKSLFAGRFWKIVSKGLYPVGFLLVGLMALGLISLLFIPLSMLSKTLGFIFLGIVGAAAVAFFILMSATMVVFTYKLYRELVRTMPGAAASAPVAVAGIENENAAIADSVASASATPTGMASTQVPKWIKVFAWIGFAIGIGSTIVIGCLYAFNPEFRAGFKDGANAHKSGATRMGSTGEEGVSMLNGSEKVFDAYGLYFVFPAIFTNTGPNGEEGSVAQLENLTSPNEIEGFMPIINILAFNDTSETADLSSIEAAKKFFVPSYETGKKNGSVVSYTVEERNANGIKVAVIESKEKLEGKDIATKTVIIKTDLIVYVISALALQSEEPVIAGGVDKMLNTLTLKDVEDLIQE